MKMFLCKLILCNGSVYYKSAHRTPPPPPPPLGICQVFVLEKLQMLYGGAGHSYKNPHNGA